MGRAVFTGKLLGGTQALRPIDPVILAQSRTTLSFLVLAPLLLLRNRSGATGARQVPGAILSAGNSRRRRVQFLLLLRHREDHRGAGDCAAIRRAGVGAALHAGATTAAADATSHQRRVPGGGRLWAGGRRNCRAARIPMVGNLRPSLQHAGRHRSGDGRDLVRLLQRLRSALAATLSTAGRCCCTRCWARRFSGSS